MSTRWKAFLDRVAVASFLLAWVVAVGRMASPIVADREWLLITAGVFVGYLLADALAGSVHWMADRFFDPETPILGPMLIAPFREHHDDPLGITRHDFFEVSGNNALVTLPVVIGLASLPTPISGGTRFLIVAGLSLTFALFVTNQFHSWAHSPSPPRFVQLLHASGLILTPRRHGIHHRGQHARAYCVTSGWLNPLLDRIGCFDRLERLFESSRRARGSSHIRPSRRSARRTT